MLDSQTVKTPFAEQRCYGGAKKIVGRKRHALVHTDGRALKLRAHSPSILDRDGAGPLLRASRASWPCMALGYADRGYAGPRVANASEIRIEVVRKADNQVGLAVIARRSWSNGSLPGSTEKGGWQKISRPQSIASRPCSMQPQA